MQHNERHLLISGITQIVDQLYFSDKFSEKINQNNGIVRGQVSDPGSGQISAQQPGTTSGDRGEVLRQYLDPLLDAFLMESQPIVATDVTILLADIRGFTALTRALPQSTLIDLLNRYFSAMCTVIKRHDGVVDKFIGDSIMALFGVPKRRPDDLQRALACSVEMQQAMVELNRHSEQRGEPRLYAGIAINTGPVMAGSFGSGLHSEYTVVGDAVNLVSRIESFSLRGQVLLSESSRTAARHLIETGNVNQVRVKGVEEPISLYELLSVNAPRRLVIPRVDIRKSPRISVSLEAIFRQVAAKHVHSEHFVGHVNDMGYYGMRADLPLGLPPYSEVVVNLRPELNAKVTGEVYARVLRAEPRGPSFRTSLEFTNIDTPGHRHVKEYVDDQLWRR
jgi:adenylate cyclase